MLGFELGPGGSEGDCTFAPCSHSGAQDDGGAAASAHDFQSHSIQQHIGGERVEAHAGGFGEPGLELAHVSSTYIPLATPHRTVFWKM